MYRKLRRILLGAPLDPFQSDTRHKLTLVALLAWVGLGADALSSSCYGPEEAFIALGANAPLALFIAVFTVVTVFIICLGYNQVIELFPNGGGGYQVASKLLHPYAGLVAGSALIVDYVLTIAISVAAGADAIFSFMPLWVSPYKIYFSAICIVLLLALNLRGMKEAIIVLVPIFIGFLVMHVGLIVYGVIAHANEFHVIVTDSFESASSMAGVVGWFAVIGVMLHAYSLGSGTYTGIEAVSNNVQHLAEPRVATGKRTMMYLALSLSFMAGGFILLYLLWHAQPVPGKTLNAVVFQNILGDSWLGETLLVIALELEACLLFVAANAGFAAGPSVLANMATDNWLPKRFSHLSSRLVVQNGLLLFGGAALAVLFITGGSVSMLVVLYSINVFITFSLSLLGVAVYWARHQESKAWRWHFLFSLFACLITTSILCATLYYKFTKGGWLTLLITATIIGICLLVKQHYRSVKLKLEELDKLLEQPIEENPSEMSAIDANAPTAIIFINSLSVGMHTLLSILRIFPGQFTNFIFISAGEVDAGSFKGEHELEFMQEKVNSRLDYFVKYCHQYQMPAEGYSEFGTDRVEVLKHLADKVSEHYPRGIFFSTRLIFSNDTPMKWLLHNQTPLLLQQFLHGKGKELMILPMKL